MGEGLRTLVGPNPSPISSCWIACAAPLPQGEGTISTLLRDRLDPAAHVHVAGPAAIDGARRVSRNALWHVGARRDLRNEGHHLAVLGAADANALLEAGIDLAAVIARLM